MGPKILSLLPEVSAAQWKKWYRNVSKCVHPDHGGSDTDFAVLNSLNEMINTVIENEEKRQAKNAWEADYKIWKEDKGYESDFIEEKDLK